MTLTLKFLGAAGTVTGSRHLLRGPGINVLVDCGLFQGFKPLRQRNWEPFPVPPREIETVVLTHAHLDHSGYIPLFVKKGFRGRVLCTRATHDLCEVLLRDSGHLLERDAEFANRHGFSKHLPAKPLYTVADAETSLERFDDVPFGVEHRLGESGMVTFLRAGHILGASIVRIVAEGKTVVFSGDLGRTGSATMLDPATVPQADYVVVESTYGNRLHDRADPEDELARIINATTARGGTVIVPAFAVGRTQSLLYHLSRLKAARRIPDLPVFLDSPMATNASEIFCHHIADQRLTAEECRTACNVARYVRDVEESKGLDGNAMPKVIISASGMATGGRVLHHLKRYAPDNRNAILFTGFQAGGTRGEAMTGGAQSVKIHGQRIPIRAHVENMHMLSAHADADEILAWLGGFGRPPKTVFITHGEPEASEALRLRIANELRWSCHIAEHGEEVTLP